MKEIKTREDIISFSNFLKNEIEERNFENEVVLDAHVILEKWSETEAQRLLDDLATKGSDY